MMGRTMFDVRSFEAKNMVFKLDYQKLNMFKSAQFRRIMFEFGVRPFTNMYNRRARLLVGVLEVRSGGMIMKIIALSRNSIKLSRKGNDPILDNEVNTF